MRAQEVEENSRGKAHFNGSILA